MNKLLNLCGKDWWFWFGLITATICSILMNLPEASYYWVIPLCLGWGVVFSHFYSLKVKLENTVKQHLRNLGVN